MFEKLFEKRDISTLSTPSSWFTDIFASPTSSGESVTTENALNVSAVYACVNVRGNTIAKMPIHVYKLTSNGKERVKDNISYLLETRPNPLMTPFVFKHTMSCHIDLWGNAYVLIEANKGVPSALWLLNPSQTSIYKDAATKKVWYITVIDDKEYKFTSDEIMHFKALSTDGIVGKSRIAVARETIGNMSASSKLTGKYFANGTTAGGVLTHPSQLAPDAKDQIRKAWQNANSGLNNAGKVAILDCGLDYKSIGMSFEDAQLIQLSKFSVEEIARIFNVPMHMINSLDKSSFDNIQQQSLDFISNSIQPTITDIEEEINYKLFSDLQQKQGYYVKFNMASSLRADDVNRANFYEKMMNLGAYSINDVLRFEEMNTIEHGDGHRVSLNYVDVAIADEYQLNQARGKGGE